MEQKGTMSRLPFALSIPHGGLETPEEFQPWVVATAEDQREDIDHLTCEIFGLGDGVVARQLTFPVARTFVDLNRRPEQLGVDYPDGVVKTTTHLGRPVFSRFPEAVAVERVLDRTYRPYHRALGQIVEDPEVVLLIDCHSMAPRSLPSSPDQTGQPRPLINLGHRGGRSAPLSVVERYRAILAEVYRIPAQEISIDTPFTGGYITDTYHQGPSSWALQIEFNRAFYLGDQEGRVSPRLTEPEIAHWRDLFARSLHLLYQHAFSDVASTR